MGEGKKDALEVVLSVSEEDGCALVDPVEQAVTHDHTAHADKRVGVRNSGAVLELAVENKSRQVVNGVYESRVKGTCTYTLWGPSWPPRMPFGGLKEATYSCQP